MLVEIRGCGFKNKGAQLMLCSIIQNLKTNHDICTEVSKNNGSQPYSKRAELKLFQSTRIYRRGINIGFFWKFIPKFIKEMYGVVDYKKISLVLDASGYSYSDSWGTKRLIELQDRIKQCKRFKSEFIFMPQAFGPFKDKKNKRIMKWCVNNSYKTYCRDRQSYNELIKLNVEKHKLDISPDFTSLLKSEKLQDNSYNKLLIVPNYRMVDKGNFLNYPQKISEIINKVHSAGLESEILIHEGDDDKKIALEIANFVNFPIKIITPESAVDAKNIISKYKIIFSGRYHASVSALSSGVPCFSTSWSHKYKYMHEDFNFIEGLVDNLDEFDYQKILDLNGKDYDSVKEKILEASIEIESKNKSLFNSILNINNIT